MHLTLTGIHVPLFHSPTAAMLSTYNLLTGFAAAVASRMIFISSKASSRSSDSLSVHSRCFNAVTQNTQDLAWMEYAKPTPSGTTSPYPHRAKRGWLSWLVLMRQRLARAKSSLDMRAGTDSWALTIMDNPRRWRSTPCARPALRMYLLWSATATLSAFLILTLWNALTLASVALGPIILTNVSMLRETVRVVSVRPCKKRRTCVASYVPTISPNRRNDATCIAA
mmetsp:Transcript_21707/g.60414  ORF Transcript_21707/g.60414 Transcript_21707/m.60414 type:complete len:225 (-) Transcript_21707:72-746(-)